MATKHQKITVKIPTKYSQAARLAIAQEIIDRIVERTREENKDKDGDKFPSYSKSYMKSAEFAAGGKSKNVDLTLSGDMLSALRLLNQSPGEITIGYESGSTDNAKADGNIRGTYGKPKANPSKARDFLGISKQELEIIKENFPLDDPDAIKDRIIALNIIGKKAKQITGALKIAELDGEEDD